MKKLNVFLVVAFSIIVLYGFPSFAEKIYPPGEIYAIEAITTDSYPDMRKRAENAEGSWQQDDTGWWW